MDAIENAAFDELTAIDDIGEVIGRSLAAFFALASTATLIERLKRAGVKMKSLQEEKSFGSDNRFTGITFVLTGALPSYSRSEASAIIESFGGKVSGRVSKKTGYVLAGADPGSKLTKAQGIGIKIIDENQFKTMIE
jgi:DNA ligase (NAD+)